MMKNVLIVSVPPFQYRAPLFVDHVSCQSCRAGTVLCHSHHFRGFDGHLDKPQSHNPYFCWRRSCLSIENDPTIFLGVVLGHFFHAWKAGGREIIQLNDCGLRVDHVQTSGVLSKYIHLYAVYSIKSKRTELHQVFLSSNTPYCQKFKVECLDFNEKTEDSLDRTSVPHRDAQDFVCHGCYTGKGEWVGRFSDTFWVSSCGQVQTALVWWQNTTSSYLTKLWSKRFYILIINYTSILLVTSCFYLYVTPAAVGLSKSKASTLWLDAFWCGHLHCWPRCTSRGNITGSFLRADQSSPQGTSEMHGNS